jgi:hypothetical protein
LHGRSKVLPQVAPDTVLGPPLEGLGGGWVDVEEYAVEVVHAHQAEAILDQVAVKPFAGAVSFGNRTQEVRPVHYSIT